MNAVEQTRTMMQSLHTKLESEMDNLAKGFKQQDFALITNASNELNLFAHRGYDLATDKSYARFKRTTREEFMSQIQLEFLVNGIDLRLPDDKYGGEAIYFYAFGERLGVLYGENKQLHTPIAEYDLEFFDKMLLKKNKNVASHKAEIAKLDAQITTYIRVMENPALIRSEEFREERRLDVVQSNARRLLKLSNHKIFGGLYDYFKGIQLMKGLQTDEARKRLQKHIDDLVWQKGNIQNTMKVLEEQIAKLETHQEELKPLIQAFFDLLKKYNIPFTHTN
jgi:hypothetical protein